MRNGRTKRASCGTLRIDVNPLLVVGGLGEGIDALLVDQHRLAARELLAHQRRKIGQAREPIHEARSITGMRTPAAVVCGYGSEITACAPLATRKP